jgi:uncharacterized protein YyaL (SSP411 family)
MEDVRLSCLKATKSPFVLEGLHSPVKWWGWCREAFEAARALDRPVLVDVGAVWCHWCHVMDETTYSDPEVASFINEHFIPIKVDRDERPDVDKRLQEMAQLISGQAGWPLTVFMTPSGEVIWAATYIPPRDMGRTPGMLTILKAVLEAYREKRGEIAKFAEELRREVEMWHSPTPGELEREVQLELLTALASSFDAEYGGFGGAPKFPPITQLELLLMRYFYDGVGLYRKMAEATLDAMALGGVYDHLLGGFFRYSTDRMWLTPHYEKLLIDNAELLAIYAEAYALFRKPLYLRTARGIVAWLDEFMRKPGGGYYASQDADVEGEEGGYYRWTLEEVREAAGDLWPLAVRHFGLLDVEWPEGKATLRVAEPMEGAEVEELYRRLLAARRRRKPPRVDTTVYSGWSCAAARAELLSARLASVGDWRHALETVEFVMAKMWDGKWLAHGWRDGAAVGRAVVEDYGYCILAALEAYARSRQLKYLDWGLELADVLTSRFLDAGGFRDVEEVDPVVATPHYPFLDTPNFSGNSVAAISLVLLSMVTGRQDLREAAGKALRALFGKLRRVGPSAAGLAVAVDLYLMEPPRTVVVGDAPALAETALSTYRPWHLAVPVAAGEWPYPEQSIKAMLRGPRPAAYVCAGTACSMPLTEPEKLRKNILEFRKEAYRL